MGKKRSGAGRFAGLWVPVAFTASVLIFDGPRPSIAQSSRDVESLKSDIEVLKAGQAAIQRDLSAIKQLLTRATTPQGRTERPFAPQDMTIAGAATLGAADAPVVLVEFTDYQCPFCRRHSIATKPRLVKDYVEAGKLRYVMREFPLRSIHPQAPKAAEAALCAKDQGKYWSMNKAFFTNPRELGIDTLKAHAKRLKLDSAQFNACLDQGKYAGRVQRDLQDGMRAGIRGTPSFLLGLSDPNNPDRFTATRILRGALPYSQFKHEIDALLAHAKNPS
jgi:protein-disulfide isomerase